MRLALSYHVLKYLSLSRIFVLSTAKLVLGYIFRPPFKMTGIMQYGYLWIAVCLNSIDQSPN